MNMKKTQNASGTMPHTTVKVNTVITGMMGGAFSLTAPVYTSEIAHKDIRSMLGSCFQLMVTVGILFVYGLGILVLIYFIAPCLI
jgi:hypothetical protein